MADYGHAFTFGTFITPQNKYPQEVVALAQLSEQAGLDLVTFQDHPSSRRPARRGGGPHGRTMRVHPTGGSA